MKLILIRHSKTRPTPDVLISQWGLTEEGIERAEKLSQRSIIKELEVIYSSLQTKALETALILAKPNVIPIRTEADLDEISSFTRQFFGARYEKNVEDFYSGNVKRFAEGETIQEAMGRFAAVVERIIKKEIAAGNENVGIVSHGNILSFFSAQFCNEIPRQLHDKIRMPDAAVLDWESKKFVVGFGQVEI